MDDMIAQFVACTGTEPQQARRFLDEHSWNVQLAIEIYLAQGDAPKNQIKPEQKILIDDSPLSKPQTRSRRQQQNNKPSANSPFQDPFQSYGPDKNNKNNKVNQLGDMFRQPFDMMFKGFYVEALASAKDRNRYCIINIHKVSEFDCHRLNRDTWSDSTLKALIKNRFIFWQGAKEHAETYCRYHPINKLPHIAVIDPRTGENMATWEGLIKPEDIKHQLEELLVTNPFDSDIVEIPAPRLPPKLDPKKEKVTETLLKQKSIVDWSEDDQMARAIMMSLNKEDGEEIDDSTDMDGLSENEPEPEIKETNGSKKRPREDEEFSRDVKQKIQNVENHKKRTFDDLSGDQSNERNVKQKLLPREKRKIEDEEFTRNVKQKLSHDTGPDTDTIIPEDLGPMCMIKVKLTDGKYLQMSFPAKTKLCKIYEYIANHRTDSTGDFSLVSTFPRRVFSDEELQKLSIEDAGLGPRAMLIIENRHRITFTNSSGRDLGCSLRD